MLIFNQVHRILEDVQFCPSSVFASDAIGRVASQQVCDFFLHRRASTRALHRVPERMKHFLLICDTQLADVLDQIARRFFRPIAVLIMLKIRKQPFRACLPLPLHIVQESSLNQNPV